MNIYNLVCLGFKAYQPVLVILSQILLIHIYKYISFDLFGFYGISTIVGYFMANPGNTYIYKYI